MTDVIDYKTLFYELVDAIGYDPETVVKDCRQSDVIAAAKILRRVAVTMQTQTPEKTGALFLCGVGGERDDMGLPERIHICPTYGLAGTATYTKTTDYNEPGW
jgi:hypothetical protein